jgi:hypothetical protein
MASSLKVGGADEPIVSLEEPTFPLCSTAVLAADSAAQGPPTMGSAVSRLSFGSAMRVDGA